jgi:hypothetical protein
LSGPIKFCLLVILTHLNGRASAAPAPGAIIAKVVKEVFEVSNWPIWPFDPQGPDGGVAINPGIPVYFSQQSWSS